MMELETMHDREYYLAKAAEHPLLEQVIAGDATFKEQLDGIMEIYLGGFTGFKEYLDILAEVGTTGLNKDDLLKRYGTLYWAPLQNYVHGFAIGAIGLGIILSAVGPFVIVEPLIAAAGGGGIRALRKKRKYLTDTRKRKDEIFKPLYDAAESIDSQIGMCFLLNHFNDNRERFEVTYTGMSGMEREVTDELLSGLLGVGGMKNMDEIQLGDYLTGILESVV